jgi:hypothetical protein
VQEQHGIGDFAGSVARRRPKRDNMLLQLGELLAAGEDEVFEDEKMLGLVRPGCHGASVAAETRVSMM